MVANVGRAVQLRPPGGPLLEMQYYWDCLDDADAFAAMVDTVVDSGARVTGSVIYFAGPGARSMPFGYMEDGPLASRPAREIRSLSDFLRCPDVRALKVEVEGFTGLDPRVLDFAGYLRISEEAVGHCQHVLEIVGEGEVLCAHPDRSGRVPKGARERARSSGRKVLDRFRQVTEALRPSYAAINCERALPCPYDLGRGYSVHWFVDFYISRDYLGEKGLSEIRRMYEQAYLDEWHGGVYVSCSDLFNPSGVSVPIDIREALSTRVARMIAAASSRL